jgi:hypothetical protein
MAYQIDIKHEDGPDVADLKKLLDYRSILEQIDNYLQQGGRIEKRHGRVCLVDQNGEYIVGGETTQEMLERLERLFSH